MKLDNRIGNERFKEIWIMSRNEQIKEDKIEKKFVFPKIKGKNTISPKGGKTQQEGKNLFNAKK